MTRSKKKLSLILAGAALALGAVAAPIALDRAAPAYAQSSSKMIVDSAKAAGIVGEQADGYLGVVTSNASADVRNAVNDINIQRRSHYTNLSEKSGESIEDVAKVFAIELLAKVPSGQMVRDVNGVWGRK